jgi:hypothetical protein
MQSKSKYTEPKTRGKYKPSHNDSQRRRQKHKASDRRKLEIQATQPRRVRVLLPSGKTRMVTVEEVSS